MKKKIDFLECRKLKTSSFRSSKESNIMSSKRENNLSPSVARLFESYENEINNENKGESQRFASQPSPKSFSIDLFSQQYENGTNKENEGEPQRFAWSAFQSSPHPHLLPLLDPNWYS